MQRAIVGLDLAVFPAIIAEFLCLTSRYRHPLIDTVEWTEPGKTGSKEVALSYQRFVSSARTTMMVAGAAAAVGVALTNNRRLAPVFVQAAPAPRQQAATMGSAAPLAALPDLRGFFARRIALASLLAGAGIVLVAAVAAIGTIAFQQVTSASASNTTLGPSAELRAASAMAGGYEQAYSASMPSANLIGGTLLAAAEERQAQEVLAALVQIDKQRRAQVVAANGGRSLNGASGYPVGTILRSRITIYGCAGAGGGFCNAMATGIQVFEGAAACSFNLPFGTKLKIHGDPTGRVYECLDRGALATTWVDVFFYNTQDGIAWQSLLAGTIADIEIVN